MKTLYRTGDDIGIFVGNINIYAEVLMRVPSPHDCQWHSPQ